MIRDLPRDHGFEALRVEGSLPESLHGTLFRVGPGLFSNFGRRYGHLFDADGALTAVRFAGGKAFGASRVVVGPDLKRERQAGRALYFGFGTRPPGLPGAFKPKNAANTNILCWDERVFALYEASLPTELDCAGEDIKALGESDLGGLLRRAFCAHPHRVPSRRATYNFGLRVFPWGSCVDLYELTDSGTARRMTTFSAPKTVFLHDFIVTEKHAVFLACPIRLDWFDLLLKQRSVAGSLKWKPSEGTQVIVVPLDEPASVRRFEAEPLMLFHFANAYERGSELVLDFVRYPDYPAADRVVGELLHGESYSDPRTRLCRGALNPVGGLKIEERWDRTCEFPIIAGASRARPHKTVYLVASGEDGSYPDRVAKVDVEAGDCQEFDFGAGAYPSEAIFVPRSDAGEDDGYLLTLVFDAARNASFVAVLDARDLEQEPLARVWFDHPIPMTFHGAWQPSAT